jgi:hypothetical protein
MAYYSLVDILNVVSPVGETDTRVPCTPSAFLLLIMVADTENRSLNYKASTTVKLCVVLNY